MIAIMTWNEELNEELKLRLADNRVIDSIEELEDNMDYLDKVILSKHSEWTIYELKKVLKNLTDSGIEIFYIKESDSSEELGLLIEMDVKNILFNPKDVEEIVNKIESINLFDDEDYLNGATFIPEIDETKEEKEESKEESKEEKDIIKIENTVDVEKIVKQAVESVQPVVTVKQESTFRFLLNWVYKILSLPVTLIGLIIENIGWILLMGLISVILMGVFFILNNQGISTSEFMDEVFNLISDIIAKFKQ